MLLQYDRLLMLLLRLLLFEFQVLVGHVQGVVTLLDDEVAPLRGDADHDDSLAAEERKFGIGV